MTVSGGVAGTAIALVLAWGIALVIRGQFHLNWPLDVPYGAIALGVGVATVIGMVFGIYPARAAARKDPIEALRYE